MDINPGIALITIGVVLVIGGIIVLLISRLTGPILPGDLYIKKDNLTVYIPIVSSIVISIILTILFNLFRK